jgi:hypothetical protein
LNGPEALHQRTAVSSFINNWHPRVRHLTAAHGFHARALRPDCRRCSALAPLIAFAVDADPADLHLSRF